ncbi:MAG: hypothetical protein WAN33_04630 [Candidatus Acidiferrales bacterium]
MPSDVFESSHLDLLLYESLNIVYPYETVPPVGKVTLVSKP